MSDTFEKPLGGADGGLALLRVMGENSFDSILITDASTETRIIYANEAFEQLTSHDSSEFRWCRSVVPRCRLEGETA